MKGYKVFNSDWTCRNYKYEVGKTYEMEETPICCNNGFHFCTNLSDCFNYYSFNTNNKVAEIEALGEIDKDDDDTKHCTNKIKIVREIAWEEVLTLCNSGDWNSGNRNSGNWNSGNCNSGNCNSGNRNSGNRNSGDWNSGNRNSGNRNSGNRNSGDWNSGDCNSGDWNSGNRNSGNRNSGNRNSGDWNSGDCNSGDWNSGDCNSGNCNSGNRNSGNRNSGDWNSGDCNSGDWNSGDWNSGNRNSGDWNITSFSNGCFNTEEPKIYLFDKPSDWTYRDWINSDARYILNNMPTDEIDWIYSEDMTDEEKDKHPEHETTGGFLRTLSKSSERQTWWDELGEHWKNEVKFIPNFDEKVFERITGIKIG